MIEAALVGRLLSDVDVAALVGARGYTLLLPQSATFPAFRLQLISQVPSYPLDYGRTNFFRARVQIDAYARPASAVDPYAQAVSLADAIERSIGGQAFTDGSSPAEVVVEGCFQIVRTTEYDADELKLVCVRQDYQVVYRAVTT